MSIAEFEKPGVSKEQPIKKRSVPVFRITGFCEADGYVVTEQDVLKEKLQELGLYGQEFGYSAFNPKLLSMVRKTGTFHRQDHPRANHVDCCVVKADGTISHTEDHDIVSYMLGATDSKTGAFIVYDLSKLQRRPDEARELDGDRFVDIYYEFKDPSKKKDAVVGIVLIKDLRP